MKKIIFYLLAAFVSISGIHAQTVSTYSGVAYTGSGQYNSSTISKDLRNYSRPYGILVDTAVNIVYVTHEHNVIVIQGTQSYNRAGNSGDPTVGGGHSDQTGIAAKFDRPKGMALDKDRNVIIADQNNSVIRSLGKFVNVSNQGPVTTLAGVPSFLGGHKDAANAQAEFGSPGDVAVNGDDIYVADRDNHCIRKISNGTTTTIAGDPNSLGSDNGTGSSAKFYLPSGLCLESSTSLLVADFGNGSIRRINLTTNAVTTVVTGLKAPKDLYALDGKIYIADKTAVRVYENGSLNVYAGSTTASGNVDGVGTDARFTELVGIDYNPKQKAFYVVDQGVNVIKKISTSNPPEADFTESTTSASVGQTVVLTDNSTNSPTSWQWTITPSNYTLLLGSKLTDEVVYVSFSQANSYSIKLKATNAEGFDEITKNNHINVSTSSSQITVADFDATNKTPETNEAVTLLDLSSYSPSAWTWTITPSANVTFENGTSTSSQFPVVKFADKGTYSIKLKATNVNGNDEIEKTGYIVVDYPVSIEDVNVLDFDIYPNPTKGIVFIQGDFDTENTTIEIVTATGSVVKKVIGGGKIDISELPKGLYIVRITSNNKVGTKKLIKNN